VKEIVILGIDPGTAQTGYGIIRCSLNSRKPFRYKSPPNTKNTKKEALRLKQLRMRKSIEHCLASSCISLLEFGSLKTSPDQDSPARLNSIFEQVSLLIAKHRPVYLAVESLFFNTNAVSASAVGQAIGVVKLSAARNNLKVFEYPPLKIKMKLIGEGRAEKKQVQQQVKTILKTAVVPRPNHAADALAVALCHWLETSAVC